MRSFVRSAHGDVQGVATPYLVIRSFVRLLFVDVKAVLLTFSLSRFAERDSVGVASGGRTYADKCTVGAGASAAVSLSPSGENDSVGVASGVRTYADQCTVDASASADAAFARTTVAFDAANTAAAVAAAAAGDRASGRCFVEYMCSDDSVISREIKSRVFTSTCV